MQVTVVSSENVQFTVDEEVISRSNLVRYMLADIGDNNEPIPLPNIKAVVLGKVLEYCDHHRSEPLPSDDPDDSSNHPSDERCDWDFNFLQVGHGMLFDLILAANYLEIKPLLDLGCQAVADIIHAKTTEEIRQLFNITNDFHREEETRSQTELAWAQTEPDSDSDSDVDSILDSVSE